MQELAEKIRKTTNSSLFELNPPYDKLIQNLLNDSAPNTVISVPYHLFRKLQTQIPDTVAKIDSPKNYLSLKRLEEFENKDFFEDHEISALLKYLVWKEQTKTGLLSEVGLFGQEKQTINKLNIDESHLNPEEEFFFKKALENDAKSGCLCSHQYLIDTPSNPSKDKELIIFDLENFTENLRFNLSTYLKLDFGLEILKDLLSKCPGNKTTESLMSKTTILFGLAGILFDKGNDQNFFAPRSAITRETLSSKEWQDLAMVTQNLIEISMELAEIKSTETDSLLAKWKNQLKILQDFFGTPNLETHYSWLEKDMQGNVVLRKIPYSTEEKLAQILDQYSNYKIIDENLDLNDTAAFIKKLSGLPENLPLQKLNAKSENIEITIIKDINDGDKNQIPNLLENYHKNKTEKVTIVFTAKQNLEFATLKLSQSKIPVIAQLAASSGKMQEQFKTATDNPILLVTPNTWENLEIAEQIDTLFIHKIPFTPPSDPQLLALSHLYEDPFNELQVPQAIFSLKKLIHRLHSTQPKKIIILDSRLITKSYGDQFIKSLEEIGTVTIQTLRQVN